MNEQPNKVIAALAYVIFFLPLLVCPTDQFAKFHANQGLVLLLVSLAGNVVSWFIPFIGGLVSMVVGLGVFVLFIIGVMNALQNKEQALPLIGTITILK